MKRQISKFFVIVLFAGCVLAEEPKRTGLEAAGPDLAKVVTLALKSDKLIVDQTRWKDSLQQVDKRKREILAKELGMPADKITQRMLDNFDSIGDPENTEVRAFPAFLDILKKPSIDEGIEYNQSAPISELEYTGQYHSKHRLPQEGDPERDFYIQLKQINGGPRLFEIDDRSTFGLTIRLSDHIECSTIFVQTVDGPVTLLVNTYQSNFVVSAENFTALLRRNPDKVQVHFIRPLTALGIEIPLSRYFPPVMALATTGYSGPDTATAGKAKELIKKLAADDGDAREKATNDLTKLFPLCIRLVTQAMEASNDAEVKTRLNRVVAAHPGIVRSRPYVEEKKLQNDKNYLLEIMAETPFFKAAARARLTVLFGKDYGDDPKTWPNE